MKNLRHLLFATLAAISFWLSLSIMRADPLDLWHSRNSGATNALNAVAYGNRLWVVAGGEGTILTSTDGLAWRRRSSGTTSFLNSMVFADNLFVIVGEAGTVLTSANGTNWIRRTSGTTDFLYDVSYGKGTFIAVSDTGTVLTSSNGATWTRRSATTQGVYGVAHGNGKFVTVGGVSSCFLFFCSYSSVAFSSSGAVTWTQSNPGPAFYLSDVAIGNGIFVAVGDGGTIVTSADGMSWTPQFSGSAEFLYNVAFGDGTFAVVGGQQGGILTSTDGVSWTKRDSGTSNGLFNVAHANGTFVAVGNSGTILQSGYFGAPILRAPQVAADGTVTISIVGKVGQSYRIQAATTLFAPEWNELKEFTLTSETENIVVSEAADFSSRFYRVMLAP